MTGQVRAVDLNGELRAADDADDADWGVATAGGVSEGERMGVELRAANYANGANWMDALGEGGDVGDDRAGWGECEYGEACEIGIGRN